MTDPRTVVPVRRPELVIGPPADNGQCVVKDPGTGTYYRLGKHEAFLLLRLDGPQPTRPRRRQSLLSWRMNLFDPDRLFTRMEPRLRFFWTCGFLVFSAGCILTAIALLWLARLELADSFVQALRWETLALACLLL